MSKNAHEHKLSFRAEERPGNTLTKADHAIFLSLFKLAAGDLNICSPWTIHSEVFTTCKKADNDVHSQFIKKVF